MFYWNRINKKYKIMYDLFTFSTLTAYEPILSEHLIYNQKLKQNSVNIIIIQMDALILKNINFFWKINFITPWMNSRSNMILFLTDIKKFPVLVLVLNDLRNLETFFLFSFKFLLPMESATFVFYIILFGCFQFKINSH